MAMDIENINIVLVLFKLTLVKINRVHSSYQKNIVLWNSARLL